MAIANSVIRTEPIGQGNLWGENGKVSTSPGNPSKGGGYGLIRFNKANRTATFECWPRNTDVTQADALQFESWPITVSME